MEVTATKSTASTTETTTTKKQDEDFDDWYKTAKTKIMDLNTADDDLIKYISKQYASSTKSTADTEAKRNALQQLISVRAQVVSATSNIMRILSETSRYIINNMR